MSEELKKGDLICSRCMNPAVGYVVRVGSDWADVEWHNGVGSTSRKRAKKCNIIKITNFLNSIVANNDYPMHIAMKAARVGVPNHHLPCFDKHFTYPAGGK